MMYAISLPPLVKMFGELLDLVRCYCTVHTVASPLPTGLFGHLYIIAITGMD
jgi:hypothetical protein